LIFDKVIIRNPTVEVICDCIVKRQIQRPAIFSVILIFFTQELLLYLLYYI